MTSVGPKAGVGRPAVILRLAPSSGDCIRARRRIDHVRFGPALHEVRSAVGSWKPCFAHERSDVCLPSPGVLRRYFFAPVGANGLSLQM